MPDSLSYSTGPSLTIERPRCTKCQSRMNLARITPGPKGFSIRTFECGKCEHAHIVTVEIDR
jgi:hypothetical protein